MNTSNQKFISIEGNIGSGKSTILKIIRENFPQLIILDEPLSSWQKVGEKQNVNLLGLYYQDPKRWGFTFQIYAFMSRLTKWSQFTKLTQENVKISERSLLSDRYIFASIMRDMDILNEAEYQIYLQCYRDLAKMQKIAEVKGVIYVQCDPVTCSQRIKKRAREGQGSIPLDYLQRLHDKHEEWLNVNNKSCFQQTQCSGSNKSGNISQQDGNSSEQETHSVGQKQRKQVLDPDTVPISNKIKSLCISTNHQLQQPSIVNTPQKTQQVYSEEPMSTNKKSITDQNVLIIDNSQAIDKDKIVDQIRTWINYVFAE